MLVLFRVFQGIGGAALLSTAQATMMEIFPPQQIGMVQAIFGIGIMVGPTVGPTLGGWITDNYSWPWVFFINIPIGIVAAVLAYTFVHDSRYTRASVKADFTGIGLLAIGLGSLQTVLEKGNRDDWFQSSFIIWLTITAVVALVIFVVWELRVEHPAVNLRVLRNRSFAAGTIFTSVLGFGIFGGTFIIPMYVQGLLHFTAQQTGMMLLPGAITTAIVMPITARLATRFSARNLVMVGAVGVTLSMLTLSRVTAETGREQLFNPLVIRGAAMGFQYLPMTLATLSRLRGREIAEGTGLYNLSRQIGGSIGIAILSTYVDHRTAVHRSVLVEDINAYSPAMLARLHALQAGLTVQGTAPMVAKQQAFAVIDRIVQSQSAVMAYADAFMVVAIFFIISLPLLLMFDKGKAVKLQNDSAASE
jgi:DHA2 family multidrug resistance protein